MRTLKSIVFLLLTTAGFFACKDNEDIGASSPLGQSIKVMDLLGSVQLQKTPRQSVEARTDSVPRVNYEGHGSSKTMPPVTVETTNIELVEDGFKYFNIISGEFHLKGDPEDELFGVYQDQLSPGDIIRGLNRVYRIKDGPGNFAFARDGNLTIKGNEDELEAYVPSFENNGKRLALSSIYELIDWNNRMRIHEGDLTRNSAHIDYSESEYSGFENLVLFQNGKNTHAYIIRYERENDAIDNHGLSDYTGKMIIKDFKGNTAKDFKLKNGIALSSEDITSGPQMDCDIDYVKVTTPFEDHISVRIYFGL